MRDKILRIYPDMNPESPREWDNVGTIYSREQGLNETEGTGDYPGFIEYLIQSTDEYVNIVDKMERLFDKDEGNYWQVVDTLFDEFFVWLPLYYNGSKLYFRDEEEGMIFVSKADLEKEGLSEERALEVLKGEIETFNQYLTGEVYGFRLIEAEYADGEDIYIDDIDSCWGFYGEDIYTNGVTDHVDMNEVKRVEYMTPSTIQSFEVVHSEELEDEDNLVKRCA